MPEVYGNTIDEQTRCIHYHSAEDIIAIRFRCCGKYYPCYRCHDDKEAHAITPWEKINMLSMQSCVACAGGNTPSMNIKLQIDVCSAVRNSMKVAAITIISTLDDYSKKSPILK